MTSLSATPKAAGTAGAIAPAAFLNTFYLGPPEAKGKVGRAHPGPPRSGVPGWGCTELKLGLGIYCKFPSTANKPTWGGSGPFT